MIPPGEQEIVMGTDPRSLWQVRQDEKAARKEARERRKAPKRAARRAWVAAWVNQAPADSTAQQSQKEMDS